MVMVVVVVIVIVIVMVNVIVIVVLTQFSAVRDLHSFQMEKQIKIDQGVNFSNLT